MKKLINEVDNVVTEMLDGMVAAYPQYVKRLPGLEVLVRAGGSEGKVALVSGGGSGHEPAHGGFVGKGMLDGAVAGAVFTSPTPDQVYEAIKAANGGKGVLLVIKNYTGDVMNFEMAADMAADEGIEVIIANGKRENILVDLFLHPEDTLCTRFIPSDAPISGVKKWIAHSEDFAKGEIHINRDAALKLTSEEAVSLLMVGITAVEGDFEKDDIVRIIDADGQFVGVGRANYASKDARQQMGKHGGKPMVHYDYLYIENYNS